MKKFIAIFTLALFSQFASAQKTPPTAPDAPVAAPPPPPPAMSAPPPPPPPMKPIKVRTNTTEIVVGEKSLEKTNGKEDVNVNVGDKKIIIRKRIKMSDTTAPNIEIGDRKIIIKKDKTVGIEKGENGDHKMEKVIVRKKKSADGKTETITIDTDAAEATVEAVMADLEKEMAILEKEMNGKEKEMDVAEKTLEKAKTPAETEAANKSIEKIGDEMGEIGEKMGKVGEKMGERSVPEAENAKIDAENAKTDAENAQRSAKAAARKAKHDGPAKVKNRFITFDMGVNGLMQDGGFNLKGEAEAMEIFYGKSLFYRIGAFQQRVPFDKGGHANLMWGVDFEFDNIELARPITLQNSTPFTIVTENKTFSQNRLYSSWIDVPVSLHFQTNRKSSKGFRLGVGGFGGLMLAALQDQDTKDAKAQKLDMGSNMNKIRYGAQVTLGSGPINLVARYSTSPLFLAAKGPDLNSFNVGISVIPF
jgi:hypothetical protein